MAFKGIVWHFREVWELDENTDSALIHVNY